MSEISFFVKLRDSLQAAADAVNEYIEGKGSKIESSVSSWNPDKIAWIQKKGPKGPYEQSIDFNNPDHKEAVKEIQAAFERMPELQAIGFSKGYIADYVNKKVANYDPYTNPPFYTIKFPRSVFIDPLKHVEFTSRKSYIVKYK